MRGLQRILHRPTAASHATLQLTRSKYARDKPSVNQALFVAPSFGAAPAIAGGSGSNSRPPSGVGSGGAGRHAGRLLDCAPSCASVRGRRPSSPPAHAARTDPLLPARRDAEQHKAEEGDIGDDAPAACGGGGVMQCRSRTTICALHWLVNAHHQCRRRWRPVARTLLHQLRRRARRRDAHKGGEAHCLGEGS